MGINEVFVGAPTVSTTLWSFPSASTTRVAQTSAGVFWVLIDVMANLVVGDRFTFTAFEKINGAGATQRIILQATVTGPATQNLLMGPLPFKEGWDITAIREAGADRVIPFSIRVEVPDANVVSIANNAITSAAIAASALTAIAGGVWSTVSEGTETFAQLLRLARARLLGKATINDGDGTYTYRDAGDTKNRVVLVRAGTARTVSSTDGT